MHARDAHACTKLSLCQCQSFEPGMSHVPWGAVVSVTMVMLLMWDLSQNLMLLSSNRPCNQA